MLGGLAPRSNCTKERDVRLEGGRGAEADPLWGLEGLKEESIGGIAGNATDCALGTVSRKEREDRGRRLITIRSLENRSGSRDMRTGHRCSAHYGRSP